MSRLYLRLSRSLVCLFPDLTHDPHLVQLPILLDTKRLRLDEEKFSEISLADNPGLVRGSTEGLVGFSADHPSLSDEQRGCLFFFAFRFRARAASEFLLRARKRPLANTGRAKSARIPERGAVGPRQTFSPELVRAADLAA